MIPRGYIDAWRDYAPWRTDAMVEQDLIICRCLAAIYSNPSLAENFAFRGGTALNKLYFQPSRRYSEDIDLVQIKSGPIGHHINAIRESINFGMEEPLRKQGNGMVTLTYRFKSEMPPIIPLKLKVEINTREHFTSFGLIQKDFSIHSPWWSGQTRVVTYSLDELLGTKLRALYQRRKGRDLFDLWLGLTEGNVHPENIVQSFKMYMQHSGASVSRKEFLTNLAEKKKHPTFLSDMSDLLPSGLDFEPASAFHLIEEKLIALL